MKVFEAHEFLRIAQDFTKMAELVGTDSARKMEGDRAAAAQYIMTSVGARCAAMGLAVTAAGLREMEQRIPKGTVSWGEFQKHAGEMVNTLRHELSTILLLGVDADKDKYFNDVQTFGPTVADAFPKAAYDIEEAAKCFALDRGTAAVFHLMRVMEEGLKALAKLLGIPYAPSWESYIGQISAKIETKHKKKGIKWKRDEPFFKEILGNLMTVKIAWRNPTMHMVRTYQPDEAEDVFKAVRTFMQRLAKRIAPEEKEGSWSMLMRQQVELVPVPGKFNDPFAKKDGEKTKT